MRGERSNAFEHRYSSLSLYVHFYSSRNSRWLIWTSQTIFYLEADMIVCLQTISQLLPLNLFSLCMGLTFFLLFTEIRAQLIEQLKCLDQQCELRVQLLQDLQDFFRKKAEIEMDYSRNLEKLAERFLAKTRSTKDQQFK